MGRMPRYSLKRILIGLTLFSIGFGMLAIGFRIVRPPSQESQLLRTFLIAFGGMFVGYGVATPVRYPPHQMMLAMAGMFAAEGWDSGSYFGLIVYVVLLIPTMAFNEMQRRRATPKEKE
jgi:hypothetical protein